MKTTVVYKYCLSAEDNSNLNLFVYNLTTLSRWIGERINKWS